MADQQNGARQLDTWKEIAAYLGVSTRTAQQWAKHSGMPVNRMPGSRTRVWASLEQLDEWNAQAHGGPASDEQIADKPGDTSAAIEPPLGRGWLPWRAVAILAILAAAGVATFELARFFRKGQPALWRVDRKTLIVSDERNRDLWRFDLPDRPAVWENVLPQLQGVYLADLDGDGQTEVLYAYDRYAGSDPLLYCFRANGKLAWTYRVHRSRTNALNTHLEEQRRIRVLGSLKHARPDGGIIVVGGYCAPQSHYAVEVLTAGGHRVAEYFHPGYFVSMVITDLHRDGHEEILLGGVNDAWYDQGYGGATLVVLDSARVEGQGPVPSGDSRQIAGVPTGLEKAVLLFREFARGSPLEYCHVISLEPYPGGMTVWVQGKETVAFRLDSRLRLTGLTVESVYEHKLLSRLPPGAPYAEKMALLNRELAHIKVLKNDFDPSYKGTDPEPMGTDYSVP